MYECSECTKVYKHFTRLKAHMIKHNDQTKFSCTHCSRVFSSLHILIKHHHHVHPDIPKYECGCCGKHFKHMHSLYVHVNRKRITLVNKNRKSLCYENDWYWCYFCGKNIKRNVINRHMKLKHKYDFERTREYVDAQHNNTPPGRASLTLLPPMATPLQIRPPPMATPLTPSRIHPPPMADYIRRLNPK